MNKHVYEDIYRYYYPGREKYEIKLRFDNPWYFWRKKNFFFFSS